MDVVRRQWCVTGQVPRRLAKTHRHVVFGGFHPPCGRCPWLKSRRADWSWINEAAERFEQAWKKGPRPRIEDFLAKEPEPRQPPLLSELLRVECELRTKAGERPTAEEYRRRFPEHDDRRRLCLRARSHARSGRPSLSSTGAATTTTTSDQVSTLPPELANHPDYEIIRELGHGGMGVVFLAHNRHHGTRRGAQGHRPRHHR